MGRTIAVLSCFFAQNLQREDGSTLFGYNFWGIFYGSRRFLLRAGGSLNSNRSSVVDFKQESKALIPSTNLKC
jgi:hypothetical protein